ncbi:MAG: beta-galactosidase [Roseiflexaceae bacterium]
MQRYVWISLILWSLVLSPQQAQAAQPTQISFFGMNTYITGLERIKIDGDEGITHLVGAGRSAGVAWAREELSWANIEPGKQDWNWPYFDKRIGQLANAGYGIIGMLLTTPEWARVPDCKARAKAAGALEYWCPPANPRDYADYVWTMVERYDGDGTFDAPGSPRIAAWQIWNEPSAPLTWPGSAAEYGTMLVMAYQAAKSADPSAIVTLGGVYLFDGLGTDPTDGIKFYTEMVAQVPDSINTFDALPIHPYMTSVAPDAPKIHASITLWGRLQLAQRWLNTHQGQRGVRPLWISEMGWATCRCGENCPPYSVPSEDLAATYLVRAHAIALAQKVQHVSYFQLEDKFDGRKGEECDDAASILDTEARGYREKPSFAAYRTMTGLLNGATFQGFGKAHNYRYNPNDQNYIGLYHLRFRLPDGSRVDLLWRTLGEQMITLALDSRRGAELFDRDGGRTQLSGASARLTIGERPIYLRQK